MKISIVIPAYNEEKRISSTLTTILKYLKKNKIIYEILIVDDCSNDKTKKLVSKFVNHNVRILENQTNKGKGYSIRIGILEAKHPLVLFSDSDLSTPIEELSKFLRYMNEGYDIVIASRNLKDSNVIITQPFYRQILGKIFPILVRILLIREIKDTQCGFKLFKTEVAKKIVKLQTIERFSFDVELLIIAKMLGYKIKEVPVNWINSKESKLSLRSDVIIMFFDLIKIKINKIRGKYDC